MTRGNITMKKILNTKNLLIVMGVIIVGIVVYFIVK